MEILYSRGGSNVPDSFSSITSDNSTRMFGMG